LIVKYLLIILLYIQFATQIGDYLQLITDSGEFYLKYNGVSDNEFRYSLFAEVGLADDFGENIYIPFHMLIWFENCDYPAKATPFKGQVYFSKQFSLVDVHGYYESKGIYTVEPSPFATPERTVDIWLSINLRRNR
jgi:hypothetical protein